MILIKGLFVVLEGIDGSGKTTVGKEAVNRLNMMGIPSEFTYEPSELPTGKLLRQILSGKLNAEPITQALLFAADREEHLKNVVIPLLEQRKLVICDRYLYASMAYQGAKGVNMKWIRDINRSLPHYREPDAVVYLDIEPESSLLRTHHRKEKDIFESVAYLKKVRAHYLSLSRDMGFTVLNAEQTFEKVVRSVINVIAGIDAFNSEKISP